MGTKESLAIMTKEQVIHSIVYAMFQKKISLEELTKVIREKEKDIIIAVEKHLSEAKTQDKSPASTS